MLRNRPNEAVMKTSIGFLIAIAACMFACGSSSDASKSPSTDKDKDKSSVGESNPTPAETTDPEQPAEKPAEQPSTLDGATLAITVDGQKVTPTRIERSSDSVPGGITRFHARVFFSPTAGAEQQIHLTTYTAATGCFSGGDGSADPVVVQGVEYKAGGKVFQTPLDDFACGLIVSDSSATSMKGSFAGQVREINDGPAAPVSVSVQFDIPAAKK